MLEHVRTWWHLRRLERGAGGAAASALLSLARIGTPPARAAVVSGLLDARDDVRQAAEEASRIVGIDEETIRETYVRAVSDPKLATRNVRTHAAKRLRESKFRHEDQAEIVRRMVALGSYDPKLAGELGIPPDVFADRARAVLAQEPPAQTEELKAAATTLARTGGHSDVELLLRRAAAIPPDVQGALRAVQATDAELIRFHQIVVRERDDYAARASAAALAQARVLADDVLAALTRHPAGAWTQDQLLTILSFVASTGRWEGTIPFVETLSGETLLALVQKVRDTLPPDGLRRLHDAVGARFRTCEPPVYESMSDGWWSWEELRSGDEDYPALETALRQLSDALASRQ